MSLAVRFFTTPPFAVANTVSYLSHPSNPSSLEEKDRSQISDLGRRFASRIPAESGAHGCGLCGGKTKNIQHNLEMQLEAEFSKLLDQQGLKTHHLHGLDTDTFTAGADYWQAVENNDQLKRLKVLDYVARDPARLEGRSVVLRGPPRPETR